LPFSLAESLAFAEAESLWPRWCLPFNFADSFALAEADIRWPAWWRPLSFDEIFALADADMAWPRCGRLLPLMRALIFARAAAERCRFTVCRAGDAGDACGVPHMVRS
jgi:hypothetical protein